MSKTRYIPIPGGEGGGGEYVSEPLNVTQNGVYTPGPGVNGFKPVNVHVPASEVDEGTKQVSITQNGTVTEDVVGYANAEINVQVPASSPEPYKGYLKFDNVVLMEGASGGTITFSCVTMEDLQINKNNGGWTDSNGVIPVVNGDSVEVRGNNPVLKYMHCRTKNVASCRVSGNPSSLIQRSGCDNIPDYAFQDLFYHIDAQLLLDLYMPKVIGKYGFYRAFENVTLIENSDIDCSELEVLGERAFSSMFSGAGITGGIIQSIPVTGVHGCDGMFLYSTLSTPPALPATILAESCYQSMFQSSAITSAPALPATVIDKYAYSNMFTWCGNLHVHPTFPEKFHYIGEYGMSGMFTGCPIHGVPDFKAYFIDDHGCEGMYYGSGDTSTGAWYVMDTLEIDMMGDSACYNMFQDAERMVGINTLKLPEFIPSNGCYNMFSSSNLGRPDTIPGLNRDIVLNVKAIGANGCDGMFRGTHIGSLTINANSAAYNSLNSITENCAFITLLDINVKTMHQPGQITTNNSSLAQVNIHSFYIDPNAYVVDLAGMSSLTCNVNSMLQGTTAESYIHVDSITWNANDLTPNYFYLEAVAGTSISGGPNDGMTEYRINGGSWTTWASTGITGLTTGDKVEFRGTNTGKIPTFILDDTFNIGGCMTTLQDTFGYVDEMARELFYQTFKNQAITDATHLEWGAMNLAQSALREAFYGTQIVNVPDIVFYQLANDTIRDTFNGVTTDPGKLNIRFHVANQYVCLYGFQNCAITRIGDIKVGKINNSNLFDQTFKGSSLVSYDSITVGILKSGSTFSGMFRDCRSLYTCGDITIYLMTSSNNVFNNMFMDCSSLVTTPNLIIEIFNTPTAAGNNIYSNMFKNCTSLENIQRLDLHAENTQGSQRMSIYQGLFQGCTSLTSIPSSLLAGLKMVSPNVVEDFASGCTSLTSITIPNVREASSMDNPFKNFVAGCTSLNEIRVQMVNLDLFRQNVHRFLSGVASTGTLHQLSGQQWTIDDWHTYTGLPSGWTVVSDL